MAALPTAGRLVLQFLRPWPPPPPPLLSEPPTLRLVAAPPRRRHPPRHPHQQQRPQARKTFPGAAREKGRRKEEAAAAAAAIGTAGALVPEEPFLEGDGAPRETASEEEAAERRRSRRRRRRSIAGVDQSRLVEPHLLADADSRFAEFRGVQFHHKVARPAAAAQERGSTARMPAVLLHGFGASLFSWERVLPGLAALLGAPALAFDRPAFGLTSRAVPPHKGGNSYGVGFSAAAALAFVDFLGSDRALLIGHSAGSLVAVEAYFQCPEKVAALVLVAPAMLAPPVVARVAGSRKKQGRRVQEGSKNERADALKKSLALLLWAWSKVTHLLRMISSFVVLVLNKFLEILFRSPPAIWLVRKIMDKGGPWAVRYAFFDIIKADKYVLDGYTRPLRCRDWERALLEYCLAEINNTEERAAGKKKLRDVNCPVLVVTGDSDRFVPDWNSENLVKVFPRAEFKCIKNCGHLPQEETPREFLEAVKSWLSRMFQEKAISS